MIPADIGNCGHQTRMFHSILEKWHCVDCLLLQIDQIRKGHAADKTAEFWQERAEVAERLIEEKNRALFGIINIIGPTSAAKCEGCLFEMEEALRIARAAFEDKPIEKRKDANG